MAIDDRHGILVCWEGTEEVGMFYREIWEAVRRAESSGDGRWTITSRSPRSAVAELTVDAAQVRSEVTRLQLAHFVIMGIERVDGQGPS